MKPNKIAGAKCAGRAPVQCLLKSSVPVHLAGYEDAVCLNRPPTSACSSELRVKDDRNSMLRYLQSLDAVTVHNVYRYSLLAK
jgi:hypothetical protein